LLWKLLYVARRRDRSEKVDEEGVPQSPDAAGGGKKGIQSL